MEMGMMRELVNIVSKRILMKKILIFNESA